MISAELSTYEEELIKEMRETPEEYHRNLSQIVSENYKRISDVTS